MGLNAPGINFELFCEPLNEQDKSYHERSKKGTVCLVLGAGNQDFITLIDIFQRVFIHNECVLIKHHPIRQFLYDPYYIILQPLIERNIVHMLEDLDNEFKDNLDYVITLCAEEICPVLPSKAKLLHWANEDPANPKLNKIESEVIFRKTRESIFNLLKKFMLDNL